MFLLRAARAPSREAGDGSLCRFDSCLRYPAEVVATRLLPHILSVFNIEDYVSEIVGR